jgi:hypothetical protein
VWFTVLALGIAVNFEPTRIGLVPLLLARQKPLLQLFAFFVGSVVSTVTFGLLVLFGFQRSPHGISSADGGKAQIAVGAIALVVAAGMAAHGFATSRGARGASHAAAPDNAEPGAFGKTAGVVRGIIDRGQSPWVSGLVGLAGGVPSVDFLAVLVIIGTSPTSEFGKVAALALFVALGSLVVTAPLIGYLIAPEKTLDLLGRFGTWSRSRSRMEYAVALALVGCLLIGLGFAHMAK